MNFLTEYGLFLVKAITIVFSALLIAGGVAFIATRTKIKEKTGKLTLEKINDKYDQYQRLIEQTTHTAAEKKSSKNIKKNRLFLLSFQGDMKASHLNALREEITALIVSKKSGDEVLLCLESAGGMVNAYGLAAAQIQRLKDEKIKLTIAIDKVAASGGYMMACLADHLIAAPFSIIGSIGVIAQLPNFNRWLDKKEIDFEQIFAGQYKRTLTLFGKNTEAGRQKLQEEVDDMHLLFKNFVQHYRPQVDIEKTATGEHWLATRAIDLKLVDEIKTSDDYLLSVKDQFDIYEMKYMIKKSFMDRISTTVNAFLNKEWRHYAA